MAMATWAQQPPRGTGAGYSDQVSVGYVLVPVVVRSGQRFIDDLDRGDFRLLVDGRPIPIETLDHGEATPVRLVVLQDLSGSMALGNKLALSRSAMRSLATLGRAGDRFELLSFAAGRIRAETSLTDRPEDLLESSATWSPWGTTALHDAVSALAGLAASIESTRRAAILISDGEDNSSVTEPAQARDQVRRAELPVYVIGLETGSPVDLDRAGQKLHRRADMLNLLAHLSGGRYHPVTREAEVAAACRSIMSELRHQYVLGFSVAAEGAAKEHRLEVEARRKRLRLSFRRGYFGRPPRVAAPAPTVR